MKPTASLRYELDSEELSLPGGIALLNGQLTDGKRFRPQLLMRVADCLGVAAPLAAPYAIAVERIHNATLLHDDVVDEAQVRRNKPTLNASGENRKAILAGDLLLARALRDLGASANRGALEELFEVLVELTEGEWLQLESRYRLEVGERHLYEVARKKTASLIRWCCSVPGHLLGSLPKGSTASLGVFGTHLGIAFQLMDDCLDFDPASGKPFAQDLAEGQVNFVTQNLLRQSPEWRAEIEARLGRPNSGAFPAGLSVSLRRALLSVRRQAELEIETARASLAQSSLAASVQARLDEEVTQPVISQLFKN